MRGQSSSLVSGGGRFDIKSARHASCTDDIIVADVVNTGGTYPFKRPSMTNSSDTKSSAHSLA